jgi:Fe-S-cluster-containing dehydrogenase component
MKKWNLVIDVALCNDCNCCFMADKDEYTGNDWPPFSKAQPWEGHRWISIDRKERGQFPQVQVVHRPSPCMHCDNAPCMDAASEGTIYRLPNGLVIIDPEKAAGHPEIVDSCPYGAIYWNEEANIAQKCTGCAHLVEEGWTQTRCSQGCPTGALTLVLADDTEMAEKVAAEGLEVFRQELGTAPRVYYKNLYRWTKAFIAGSVVFGDTAECAEGAKVVVSQEGVVPSSALTNNFGDYRIDGLDAEGSYLVTIEADGYKGVEDTVVVDGGSVTRPAQFLERV